jgi:hypothetical protein
MLASARSSLVTRAESAANAATLLSSSQESAVCSPIDVAHSGDRFARAAR